MKRLARSLVRALSRPVFALASRAYVSGPDLSDAIRACHRFSVDGITNTIGYFNAPDDSPGSIARVCHAAIDAMSAGQLDSYLSIKAPPMRYDSAILDPIVEDGAARGVGIHFDSHGPETADRTFDCIRRAVQIHSRIGCTLPGRWNRSTADAELAAQLPLRVRVVKGQWNDETAPLLDPREGYLAVIDRLAGRGRQVAVATHDPVLARAALTRLLSAGTPCELELLLGLPMRTVVPIARELGVGIRIYIPFGLAWLPYGLSEIRQHPRMAWWLLKDAFGVNPFH
jgi:proline dehydrogenase